MTMRYRLLFPALGFSVAALLAACGGDSATDAPVDAAEEAAADATPEVKAESAPVADTRLETEILMKYVADRDVDARNFSVHAVEGRVIITPNAAATEAEKQRALQLTQAVDGVQEARFEGEEPVAPTLGEDAQAVLDGATEATADSPLQDLPPADEDAEPGEPSPSVEAALEPVAEIAAPAAEEPEEEPAQAEAPAPQAAEREYTVRRGESLSIIAARQLGDGSRWREIYEMNRDIIGPNPDGVRDGMTITLPAPR